MFLAATNTFSGGLDSYKVKLKRLNFILIILQLTLLSAFSILIGLEIYYSNPDSFESMKIHTAMSAFITITFSIILLCYVVVLLQIMNKLRKFYHNFYLKEKRKVKLF